MAGKELTLNYKVYIPVLALSSSQQSRVIMKEVLHLPTMRLRDSRRSERRLFMVSSGDLPKHVSQPVLFMYKCSHNTTLNAWLGKDNDRQWLSAHSDCQLEFLTISRVSSYLMVRIVFSLVRFLNSRFPRGRVHPRFSTHTLYGQNDLNIVSFSKNSC